MFSYRFLFFFLLMNTRYVLFFVGWLALKAEFRRFQYYFYMFSNPREIGNRQHPSICNVE